GDVDALMAESVDELKRDFPELYRAINVERNDRWVPALEARLREDGSDDTLVVVGAMHLLGEDGVVEKLRARGYAVERICSACAAPWAAGTITMQSTGQAGRHSRQPVQSGSTTTCMRLLPPTMASTGQAWMQRVQPMQSASTTSATSGGRCSPSVRS